MTNEEWRATHAAAWKRLDPEVRADAAQYLRDTLGDTTMEDLRTRIKENPAAWISGRDEVPCYTCGGSGSVLVPLENGVGALTEICPVCHGAKVSREMPLHFSFGMGVRNLLRQGGFSEVMLGVQNLDDYYVPLLEAAAGFDPETLGAS